MAKTVHVGHPCLLSVKAHLWFRIWQVNLETYRLSKPIFMPADAPTSGVAIANQLLQILCGLLTQAIEAAANTCCGGRAGLNEQLQTAGQSAHGASLSLLQFWRSRHRNCIACMLNSLTLDC